MKQMNLLAGGHTVGAARLQPYPEPEGIRENMTKKARTSRQIVWCTEGRVPCGIQNQMEESPKPPLLQTSFPNQKPQAGLHLYLGERPMLTPEDLKFLEVSPDFISCQFGQWGKGQAEPSPAGFLSSVVVLFSVCYIIQSLSIFFNKFCSLQGNRRPKGNGKACVWCSVPLGGKRHFLIGELVDQKTHPLLVRTCCRARLPNSSFRNDFYLSLMQQFMMQQF